MKHHLKQFTIISILIAIGAALGWYWAQPKPVLVNTYTVSKGEIQQTAANTRAGTVKACRRAKLSPSIGGLITKLPVNQGDKVKAGQLLLELWNGDLAAEVTYNEREAAAATARSQEACVVAKVARKEADRLVSLHKKNITSEEVVDNAIGNAEAKEAACKAAREATRVSQARIAVAKEAIRRTILLAPFDGTIAEINGELGEYVTPSPPGIPTPPAVDLIDNTCLYISAPIDEVDAPSVEQGMPARITLDAIPDRYFEGQVKRIAPYVLEVEKQARTVDVEASFTNPEDYQRLLPGYSADLEIILETRDNTLRIPTEALLPTTNDEHKILVYNEADSLLYERSIVTGLSNWKFTEVREGLEEGELVVVSVDRKGVEAGALAKIE